MGWPDTTDLEQRFRSDILYRLLIFFMPALFFGVLVRQWILPLDRIRWGLCGVTLLLCLLSLFFLKKSKCYFWAAKVFIFSQWFLITSSALDAGGVRVPIVVVIVIFPILSIVTLGPKHAKPLTLVGFITLMTIVVLEWSGKLSPFDLVSPEKHVAVLSWTYMCIIALSYWIGTTYESARRTAEQRAIELSRISNLGILAAGVSHEVNNPMAAILNSLELMEVRLQRSTLTPESAKPTLEIARRSVFRVDRIVKSLAKYAKDESNEPVTKISVDQVIDDTVVLCRESFTSVGIQLETPKDPTRLNVTARRSVLSQVLLSLLINSSDAVASGPEKIIRISSRQKGNSVQILVTDSGSGIAREKRRFLFTPFFTTKPPGKGLGLALACGASALARDGGRLSFDENASVTTFVMSIPM
jgi:signal transduction histidine kinase